MKEFEVWLNKRKDILLFKSWLEKRLSTQIKENAAERLAYEIIEWTSFKNTLLIEEDELEAWELSLKYNDQEKNKVVQERLNINFSEFRNKLEKLIKIWVKELSQQEWQDLKEKLVLQFKQEIDQDLKKQVEQLTTKKQELQLSSSKITSLENQLISLAKQKIKNQKQAKELLTQLETNYKEKEQTWTKQQTNYLNQIDLQKKDIQQKEQTIIGLNNSYEKLEQNKKQKEAELKQEKEELTTELVLNKEKIKALEQQLTSLSTQKITTQQTLNRTHQQLTQTQTHYQTRKTQALFTGIIGLALILYLSWPLLKQEELKAEPRTWI